MKKAIAVLAAAAMMFTSTVVPYAESTIETVEAVEPAMKSKILFREQAWDSSMDEVVANAVTDGMQEHLDYTFESDEGFDAIYLHAREKRNQYTVGGYDAGDILFVFKDDKLVAGAYLLDWDDADEQLQDIEDLERKYRIVYGESIYHQDLTEDSAPFTVWQDAEGNAVMMEGVNSIVYLKKNSPFLVLAGDVNYMQDEFGVNILEILGVSPSDLGGEDDLGGI